MTISPKSARLMKLSRFPPEARLRLYGSALEAWQRSLEQRELDRGATPAQAQLSVKATLEGALKAGYSREAKAQRDAFVDGHVSAALAC